MKSTAQPAFVRDNNRFPSALAAAIVSLCFVVLVTIPNLSGFPGTCIIGFGSILTIFWSLRVKYRGEWVMNAETIFLFGVVVQYLAAPTLLRLASNDFAYYLEKPITPERWEVKEGYCGAMLVVLGYVAAFLVGSSFFTVKRLPRDEDGKPFQRFTQSSMWFSTVLMLVLWASRFVLLKTGSYYHLNRSDFQYEDWRYSILSQLDTVLGILVAVHLLARYLVHKGARFWPVCIYLAFDFLWNFISGSRERALTAIAITILTFIVCRNRFPIRLICLCVLSSLFLIGFMDYYRYATQSSLEASKLELGGINSALATAKTQSEGKGIASTSITGLERLSDLESIAAIYLWVPNAVEYLRGETYISILSSLVPRFLWPDKPPVIIPINKWFYINEGGTSPTTIMGEGYLNFGWVGVLAAGFISAFLVHITEGFLLRGSNSSVFIAFYLFFLTDLARLHTQPGGIWVSMMIKMVLFFACSRYVVGLLEGSASSARQGEEAIPSRTTVPESGLSVAVQS